MGYCNLSDRKVDYPRMRTIGANNSESFHYRLVFEQPTGRLTLGAAAVRRRMSAGRNFEPETPAKIEVSLIPDAEYIS